MSSSGWCRPSRRFHSCRPLAPTQAEAPFVIAQLAVLVLFVVLGFLAVRNFYPDADAEA